MKCEWITSVEDSVKSAVLSSKTIRVLASQLGDDFYEMDDYIHDLVVLALSRPRPFVKALQGSDSYWKKFIKWKFVEIWRRWWHIRRKQVEIEDFIENKTPEDLCIQKEIIFYFVRTRVLTKTEKRVIYLRFFSELKINRIAQILNISERYVRRCIRSGCKKLQKELTNSK